MVDQWRERRPMIPALKRQAEKIKEVPRPLQCHTPNLRDAQPTSIHLPKQHLSNVLMPVISTHYNPVHTTHTQRTEFHGILFAITVVQCVPIRSILFFQFWEMLLKTQLEEHRPKTFPLCVLLPFPSHSLVLFWGQRKGGWLLERRPIRTLRLRGIPVPKADEGVTSREGGIFIQSWVSHFATLSRRSQRNVVKTRLSGQLCSPSVCQRNK